MLNKAFIITLILSICFNKVFGQVDIYSSQTSLGNKVNSPFQELNCVISPDGKKLFFTRANHPSNIGGIQDKGDVWVSEMTASGNWTDAVNLGRPLNDEGENKIIGFMDVGRAMLLHSELGIGFAYNEKGKWTKPSTVKIPYFKLKSEHQSGSISADGRYLLFGMESFGSYGVEDLYMSTLKSDGQWTSPKNLGRKINTAYQEQTPFIAADNKTLFFASNGRGGQGSYDIFMSQRLDDTWQNWTKPKNIGKQVNTQGQEFSFTFSNEDQYAYLISTQNSDGYGDIKRVKITSKIAEDSVETERPVDDPAVASTQFIDFNGLVYNNTTKSPIKGVRLSIITDPDTLKYETFTNTSGAFSVAVQKRAKYELKLSASKYLSLERILTESDINASSQLKYYLEPLAHGNTIKLDHVLFQQGTAALVEGSEKELDLVVEMMKANPDVFIFLKGHTDNRGNALKNLKLSQDRVDTVQKYLIATGIERKRVEGKGYGGLKPIASNSSEETRKLNRRVEFTIK